MNNARCGRAYSLGNSENKEETTMTNQTNPSIKCSVNSCAYHNSVCACGETECASFKLGDHGTSCGCH